VDHGGSLTLLMEKIPDTPIYCTKKGAEMIKKHFHQDWNFKIVKTGDTVDIGEYKLVFIEAPMLHWPDTMFTYVQGPGVLLSNDAFGQHYATPLFYNDQVDQCELMQEAIKYYANILTPFSKLVRAKIDELKGLNVPVNMIAPSHGVIWRDNPMQIVEKYYEWANDYQEGIVTILYNTMWGATKKMANAMAEGIESKGIPTKVYNLGKTDRNDVLTEVFKSKGILVASSTINNGILSDTAAILEMIKGLKFKNKVAAAFGSYGWSGENIKILEDSLKEAGLEVIQDGLKVKYNPTEEELTQCKEFGRQFGEKVLALIEN
jgi:flavorubredoxin